MNEAQLRELGWVPVAEALSGFDDLPALRILREVDEEAYSKVCETLKFFSSRPAFFNTLTEDLWEVGSWVDLSLAVGSTS